MISCVVGFRESTRRAEAPKGAVTLEEWRAIVVV
jgi:hypothetical protein